MYDFIRFDTQVKFLKDKKLDELPVYFGRILIRIMNDCSVNSSVTLKNVER